MRLIILLFISGSILYSCMQRSTTYIYKCRWYADKAKSVRSCAEYQFHTYDNDKIAMAKATCEDDRKTAGIWSFKACETRGQMARCEWVKKRLSIRSYAFTTETAKALKTVCNEEQGTYYTEENL